MYSVCSACSHHKREAEAQVDWRQAVLRTPPSMPNCQLGISHNEGSNILFRFINLKMKRACRQRDSSSQSVICEARAGDTAIHLSCRI